MCTLLSSWPPVPAMAAGGTALSLQGLVMWAVLAADLSRSYILTSAEPGCRGIIATEDIPAELCAEEPLILLPERLVLSTDVAQKELAAVLAFHELTRFKVGASQWLNARSCLLQARAREVLSA